jgi:hypothetical protein
MDGDDSHPKNKQHLPEQNAAIDDNNLNAVNNGKNADNDSDNQIVEESKNEHSCENHGGAAPDQELN